MVRIINYKARQREDGTTFCALEVQGGIEMVLSQKTNQYYATAKKTFISSTFDEETCKALIGTELQGSVQKEKCEPYEYVIKETGESIIMQHRFVYVLESSVPSSSIKSNEVSSDNFEVDLKAFSTNGKYDHVLAD
ncbi:hypothetical protein QX233_05990 [Chryseobacterium gambrini]|uniref:Uncharacterized protein n=1 Tax=Chryseobacterium gambrini TaxID=373672 RepID=A0AAJ1R1W0_9FLAO|nr:MULTISPECIES: hypothetical protein [Chryseobacterium]MDN4011999.1 hypothetical protein [Chryseobacterium gambrini]QWA36949.1 hypothetical protein KKI44_13495 [Chryseobacterium sp. ZHDP1]